jgi:hypothetical protein
MYRKDCTLYDEQSFVFTIDGRLCKHRGDILFDNTVGRAWILFGSRKNSKPACRRWRMSREKCLKMRQNPQRPVRAVLARF